MTNYRIEEVTTRCDLRKFVKFPDILYKDCPQYVPALHQDQIKSLTTVSTAKYCPHKMWMVYDGKKVAGRICAMINPRYNEFYKTKRARFGWFDTVNDIEVARLLISTAEAWAKSQGMNEIHGPLYYNTLGKQGMMVEGFENVPPPNCYYNFAYYNDLITQLGFVKECDWVQYKLNAQQAFPEKLERVAERVMERYKLVSGDIEKLKKDPELEKQFFDVYSDGFVGNVYNFVPFTDEEKKEEARSVKGILDKRLCCFLLDENNEIAAFGISLPSFSKAMQKAKGHLFPFGWFYLLRALNNIETIDMMIAGAAPKWQNTGVSSVFHTIMAKGFRDNGVKWAITNPAIEDNPAGFVWNKYEYENFMRRRCYIKSIK